MARTKQTPAKATGGIAPHVSKSLRGSRKTIVNLEVTQTLASWVAKVEVLPHLWRESSHSQHAQAHPGLLTNEFCMLCQDGVREGEGCLYECDEHDCPRTICTQCISIPDGYAKYLQEPDVKFRCVHCHTVLSKKSNKVTPYYGFYKDAQPIFQSFLPIVGELAISKRSQISSKPVLILHFKVVGFENTASPVDAVYSYLRPYFPNGGLRLAEVVFDLSTSCKTDKYSQLCEELMNDIMQDRDYQIVCLVITNHTNDENGDPFLGYAVGNSYVTDTIPEFMSALLDPWSKVIRGAATATLFFLGCGAIVNKVEGFSGLRLAVVDHAILSTIAFTAKHFHPAFTSFPAIIEQSGLGMHTDIILMTTTSQDGGSTTSLECIRYSWAHSTSRPWGQILPLQCLQCGCPTNWKRLKANFSGKYMIFECSFADCGRAKDKSEASKLPQRYICKAPKNTTLLPGKRRNASWMEIVLDFSQSPTSMLESDVKMD
ncbi:hypothetical protein EV702DRAFT_1195328 [Suillus placidus]|uniref:Uncharacterized protein n=1 Tax=Suillus placidus TaxID=48579 RepID=A0A9P6ZZ00_9AGAM|nr:hypothetical protein EV702DRAFT_1195328 [Suillus placidus]